MLLALAFFLDEINPSVCSLYICTYVFLTSLCTGLFNRVLWLQALYDLNVDLAVVSNLGEDCFLQNISKVSQKIKGVMRKKKKKSGVSLASFSLSFYLNPSLSIYLHIYIYLDISIYLYIYLSLSPSLSLSLSLLKIPPCLASSSLIYPADIYATTMSPSIRNKYHLFLTCTKGYKLTAIFRYNVL